MIPRPPRSTLFPTRRSSDLFMSEIRERGPWAFFVGLALLPAFGMPVLAFRSEEHTSELQSHSDLVCRLLVEKKKKNLRNVRARKHAAIDVASNQCPYCNGRQ